MPRNLSRILVISAVWLCFSPSSASAKLFLITHGDTIKNLGSVNHPGMQEELRKLGKSTQSVGFKYSYFGIFWIDFWTWGGEYCLYQGNQYHPIPKEAAAQCLGKSVGELSTPFWYTFPPGLVIIGAIVLIAIPCVMIANAKQRRVKALFNDDRYLKAMELLTLPQVRYHEAMTKWEVESAAAREASQPEPSPPEPPAPDAGHEEAITSLVREGIPREEAEQNLQAMFEHIAQQQQQQVDQTAVPQ
jgi:hypothetical protein